MLGSVGAKLNGLATRPSPYGVISVAFGPARFVRRVELCIRVTMRFLQRTRDALADLALLRRLTAQPGERATLSLFDDADHAFHVPGT